MFAPATVGVVVVGCLIVAPAPAPTHGSPGASVLTLRVPDRVATGSVVPVSGVTSDTGTVRILFRKRGQTQFSTRRVLTPRPDGRFATSYPADDDYRLYAQTDRHTSPIELVVAAPVLHAPATVGRGTTVPVVVRAAPGRVVSVSFRRQGQTAFTVRRTGRTNSAGRYTTSYIADADYRYYADERDGQRSVPALTQLQTSRSVRVSNDPAFRGQVVALDAPAVLPPSGTATITITGSDGRTQQIGTVPAERDGSLSTEVRIPPGLSLGRAGLTVRVGQHLAVGAVAVVEKS